MTAPSNTDLQEALERILIDGFADQDLSNNEKASAMTNTLLKLFQAREQQLLKGLLGELPEEKEYIDFDDKATDDQDATYVGGFNEALSEVVSVIERYREGLHE